MSGRTRGAKHVVADKKLGDYLLAEITPDILGP
jgi:hypothetical protein